MAKSSPKVDAKVHLDFNLAHFVCKVLVLVPLLHSAAWACRERSCTFWLFIHRTSSCWGLGEEERRAKVLCLFHLNPTRSSWTSKAIISHPGLYLLNCFCFFRPAFCLFFTTRSDKASHLWCVHHTPSLAHSRCFMCVC